MRVGVKGLPNELEYDQDYGNVEANDAVTCNELILRAHYSATEDVELDLVMCPCRERCEIVQWGCYCMYAVDQVNYELRKVCYC